MKKFIWALPLSIASIALVLAACGSSDDSDSANARTQPASPTPATAPAPAATTTTAAPTTTTSAPAPTATTTAAPTTTEEAPDVLGPDDFVNPEPDDTIQVIIRSLDDTQVINPDFVDFLSFERGQLTITVYSFIDEEVRITGTGGVSFSDSFFINDAGGVKATFRFFVGTPGEYLVDLAESNTELFRFTIQAPRTTTTR